VIYVRDNRKIPNVVPRFHGLLFNTEVTEATEK
jgi:hypothetical protein